MLEGLDQAGRARAFDDLRSTFAGRDGSDGVWFDSAAWLVSAARR